MDIVRSGTLPIRRPKRDEKRGKKKGDVYGRDSEAIVFSDSVGNTGSGV
jgi:hypothetical protein